VRAAVAIKYAKRQSTPVESQAYLIPQTVLGTSGAWPWADAIDLTAGTALSAGYWQESSFDADGLGASSSIHGPEASKELYVITISEPSLAELAERLKRSGAFVIEAGKSESFSKLATRIEARVRDASLNRLHIIGHGQANRLEVGRSVLSERSLSTHRQSLQALAQKLSPGADVLLYGCNIAENETGKQFVSTLGKILGADIAASTDLTFAVKETGKSDWELEYSIGNINPSYSDLLTGLGWEGILDSQVTFANGVLTIDNLTGTLTLSGTIDTQGLGTVNL